MKQKNTKTSLEKIYKNTLTQPQQNGIHASGKKIIKLQRPISRHIDQYPIGHESSHAHDKMGSPI